MKFPALFFLLTPLLLTACPGTLENPERFMRDGNEVICTLGIDVETELFGTSCAGGSCHGDGINPGAGGIDLVKAGVVERLLDKPAISCGGKPLVDTSSIGASVLLVRTAGDSCGSPMPLGTPGLSKELQDCLEAWIIEKVMSSTTAGAM